jgi:hypothetical protein
MTTETVCRTPGHRPRPATGHQATHVYFRASDAACPCAQCHCHRGQEPARPRISSQQTTNAASPAVNQQRIEPNSPRISGQQPVPHYQANPAARHQLPLLPRRHPHPQRTNKLREEALAAATAAARGQSIQRKRGGSWSAGSTRRRDHGGRPRRRAGSGWWCRWWGSGARPSSGSTRSW